MVMSLGIDGMGRVDYSVLNMMSFGVLSIRGCFMGLVGTSARWRGARLPSMGTGTSSGLASLSHHVRSRCDSVYLPSSRGERE